VQRTLHDEQILLEELALPHDGDDQLVPLGRVAKKRHVAFQDQEELVEPVFTMADQSMIERGMRRLEARGAGAVVVVRVSVWSRASATTSSGCWEWTSRDPAPPSSGPGQGRTSPRGGPYSYAFDRWRTRSV
jgi:hypothetical protein